MVSLFLSQRPKDTLHSLANGVKGMELLTLTQMLRLDWMTSVLDVTVYEQDVIISI